MEKYNHGTLFQYIKIFLEKQNIFVRKKSSLNNFKICFRVQFVVISVNCFCFSGSLHKSDIWIGLHISLFTLRVTA